MVYDVVGEKRLLLFTSFVDLMLIELIEVSFSSNNGPGGLLRVLMVSWGLCHLLI